MKRLCEKYARKLTKQGLCSPGDPIIGGLDAKLVWNREDPRTAELTKIFDELSINSLVFSKPAEPFATIIDFLASRYPDVIQPEDTETRTFLHDIPVCWEFSAKAIANKLRKRKSVIIPGEGIVSYGTVTPEQGFVFYSSTLFSCFVLFFSEYKKSVENGTIDTNFKKAFDKSLKALPKYLIDSPKLAKGPFEDEETALAAMAEAGRSVVEYGLVDSFFGNISYRHGNIIHISQTGNSLDELNGCIDPCPMDGSSTVGLTASSELTAHEDIYHRTKVDCILHGHPKFSVIMSMSCSKQNCKHRGKCHINCTENRTIDGIPIVPGEVGTGPTGLCNTLPPAMESSGAAIVHGHGVFTSGQIDFNEAFKALLETEKLCRELYFKQLAELAHK